MDCEFHRKKKMELEAKILEQVWHVFRGQKDKEAVMKLMLLTFIYITVHLVDRSWQRNVRKRGMPQSIGPWRWTYYDWRKQSKFVSMAFLCREDQQAVTCWIHGIFCDLLHLKSKKELISICLWMVSLSYIGCTYHLFLSFFTRLRAEADARRQTDLDLPQGQLTTMAHPAVSVKAEHDVSEYDRFEHPEYDNLHDFFVHNSEVIHHVLNTDVYKYRDILDKIVSITKNPGCHDFVVQRGRHAEAFREMTLCYGATIEEELHLEMTIRKQYRFQLLKGKETQQVDALSKFYVNAYLTHKGAPFKFWHVFGPAAHKGYNVGGNSSDDSASALATVESRNRSTWLVWFILCMSSSVHHSCKIAISLVVGGNSRKVFLGGWWKLCAFLCVVLHSCEIAISLVFVFVGGWQLQKSLSWWMMEALCFFVCSSSFSSLCLGVEFCILVLKES